MSKEIQMNRTLFFTALLAAFTSAVHIFIGTPEIQVPLMQSELPQEISLLLYACWHLVSITLAFSSIVLFISARGGASQSSIYTARLISYLWMCFGMIFILVAILFSGINMLLALPQWILLLPVGLLGLFGSKPVAVNHQSG